MGTRLVNKMVLVGAAALIVAGCGNGNDGQVGEAGALTFATPAELYEWMAGEAVDLNLTDVVTKRDDAGEITAVTMGKESRDILMRTLHGDSGYFMMAGKRVDLSTPSPSTGAEVSSPDGLTQVQSALSDSSRNCGNGLCVAGSSHNDHYTIFGVGYHAVGSNTSAPISTTYNAFGTTTCTGCGTRIGCTCTTTNWCNPGDALTPTHIEGQTVVGAKCTHSLGWVSAGSTFFKTIDGVNVSIGTAYSPFNSYVNAASVELTAFGSKLIWGDYPEAGINGVCGSHAASSNGSVVTAPTTVAGATSGCF